MNEDNKSSDEKTNDLCKAIYDYELKAIVVLQSVNAGAAALLINFMKVSVISNNKWFFFLAGCSYLLGLIFSIILLFISPGYLENRYRPELHEEYQSSGWCRMLLIIFATTFFVIGSILALIMLIN